MFDRSRSKGKLVAKGTGIISAFGLWCIEFNVINCLVKEFDLPPLLRDRMVNSNAIPII
jgi:hypothetical protein